jgi:chaperonin GroEL
MIKVNKETVSGSDFDSKVFSGVKKLHDVVSKTFGPNGRTVVLKQPGQLPIVTKDGYTVAKFFDVEDEIERIGVDFVRNSAKKTANIAGDGTTTTTILAYKFLEACLKMKEGGQHPVEIAKKIDSFLSTFRSEVTKHVKNIEKIEELYNVAKISTNGDEFLSKLIADAIEQVGADGMIQIKDTSNANSYTEILDGFRFNGGLSSSKLLPHNQNSLVLENCHIFIHNDTLNHSTPFMAMLKSFLALPNSVVLFAHEFDDKVLSTILQLSNDEKYKNKFIPVQTSLFGKDKVDSIEDLSVFCGAKQFGKSINTPIPDNFKLEDLGFCSKIEISKQRTLVVNGNSKDGAIELKISQLRAELESSEDEVERLKLNNRITNLSSTAVYLYVGGNNELDRIERKHRAEDAISACASAIKSGIIAGGGSTLACLSEQDNLQSWKEVLFAPFDRLCDNANVDHDNKSPGYGNALNLKTGEVVNAFDSGIIDVHMCLSNAVENAANVVKMLILSDACIYEYHKEVTN